MQRRMGLKLLIVASGLPHWRVAEAANRTLAENEKPLSEHLITQFICSRKNPTAEQAAALAAVLGCPVDSIFPDLEQGGES